MPLAVKIGQLTQLDVSMVVDSQGQVVPEKMAQAFNASHGNYIGSVINTPFSGCDCMPSTACIKGLDPSAFAALVGTVQSFALQAQKDAGLSAVPVLWGLDSVHGANYVKGAPIFPHNTGVAATMDPAAAQAVGTSAATWTRSAGIPWMFSPVLGLGMQPQWSRTYETFGEDPHVGAVMGRAFVIGAQNDSAALMGLTTGTAGIAATAKHYFGYSYPQDGKDRTDAWIPDVYLKSYFEPAFKAAFDAGILTTMINSGSVNGVPAHANSRMLTDILRDELGFRGVAVTDWQDIEKLYFYHRLAANNSQAIKLAFDAGVDMSMVPLDYTFGPALADLVTSGTITEARIDASVARVLTLKNQLGLFASPMGPVAGSSDAAASHTPHIGAAISGPATLRDDDGGSMNVTRASLTLLANNNTHPATSGKPVLPLTNWLVVPAGKTVSAALRSRSSSSATILVTGPAATTRTSLCGGWTFHWLGACEAEFTRGASIGAGVAQVASSYGPSSGLGTGINVSVVQGVNYSDYTLDGVAAAAAAAKEADVIVLAIGEAPESESEGNDNTLEMSDAQVALFEAVAAAGKPIVTVLVEPRPRILGRIALGSDALVMAYLPCYNGGVAIAELLFGELNPSGRLALTYPQFSGDITPYFRKPTGDYSQGTSQPFHSPLYTFGHGLSYATIVESAPVLSTDRLGANETLGVNVTVENHGPVDAWHTVLLFIRQLWRTSITPEERMLKAFERVFVPNGAVVQVQLSVPYQALAYVTPTLETRVEPAAYEAIVGTLETLKAPFNVTQGTSYGFGLRYT